MVGLALIPLLPDPILKRFRGSLLPLMLFILIHFLLDPLFFLLLFAFFFIYFEPIFVHFLRLYDPFLFLSDENLAENLTLIRGGHYFVFYEIDF